MLTFEFKNRENNGVQELRTDKVGVLIRFLAYCSRSEEVFFPSKVVKFM